MILLPFTSEKCIVQSNLGNILHPRIIRKFRINIEKHWHIYFFFGGQFLFFKAKTLNFVEIPINIISQKKERKKGKYNSKFKTPLPKYSTEQLLRV